MFLEIFGTACPVKLLKRYLAHFSIPSSSRDLIFSPMSWGNNSFKLVSQDKPISYTTIREAFRKEYPFLEFFQKTLKDTFISPSFFLIYK